MSLGQMSGYRIQQMLDKVRRSRAARKGAATRRRNAERMVEMTAGYQTCARCPRLVSKSRGTLCGPCWSRKNA